nr:Ig-like domain-containing protein [uncultured Bacillus sp.]
MLKWSKGYYVLVAVVLSMLLSFGSAVSAASHPFKDVIARYDEAVGYFYNSGVIKGTSATQFGTYNHLKRGDAAVILANALDLDTANAPDAGFKDVNNRIKGHVNALVKEGVINGFSDTIFAPDNYLTRGQMASILVHAFGLEQYAKPTPFTDLSISFKDEIEALYGAGITGGISANKYGTEDKIKRGDFAVLLYKTIKFSAETQIKSVNAITPIHVPVGTTLAKVNLPQEVGVVYVDGTTGKKKVQWDTTGLDLNTSGEYALQGTVEGTLLKANVKVVVHFPEIQQPNDITIVKGTNIADINFPSQVKLTYNGDMTENRNVTWDTASLDVNKVGTYVLSGNIDRLSRKTSIKVNVIASNVKVEVLKDIVVAVGSNMDDVNLPTKIKLIYSDNSYEYRNITWNVDNLNLNQAGEYVLTGAIAGTQWATTVKVIVTGKVYPDSVELNQTDVILQVGTSIQLTATLNPSYVANKTLTWTSSNNSVATVNESGKVTTVSKGYATIVVTTANGKTDTVNITVVDDYIPYLEVNAQASNIEDNRIKKVNLSMDNNSSSPVTLEKIEVYDNGKLNDTYTKKDLENKGITTNIQPNWEWNMHITWNYGLNTKNSYVKMYISSNGKVYTYTKNL